MKLAELGFEARRRVIHHLPDLPKRMPRPETILST
jgi:hypothetical protein